MSLQEEKQLNAAGWKFLAIKMGLITGILSLMYYYLLLGPAGVNYVYVFGYRIYHFFPGMGLVLIGLLLILVNNIFKHPLLVITSYYALSLGGFWIFDDWIWHYPQCQTSNPLTLGFSNAGCPAQFFPPFLLSLGMRIALLMLY